MEHVEYKHTKAEIFSEKWWIKNTDPTFCRTTFDSMLKQSGFTVLNVMEHHFEQQGYTCLWLLAESHLAIHTFPEDEKCYVELSSCNQAKTEVFKTLIAPLL